MLGAAIATMVWSVKVIATANSIAVSAMYRLRGAESTDKFCLSNVAGQVLRVPGWGRPVPGRL